MHLDARFGQLLHCFPGIHCIITQSQYRIVQKTVLACDISVFQANPRFTVTEGTQKDMIDSTAVTVSGCFSSLTVTRPVNRELKTKSLK